MSELSRKMKELGIREELVGDIVAAAVRMDQKNLGNTFSGNISARKDGKIYITPTHQSKALLTPDKVSVLNENGERIWGLKETSEVLMHRMAYEICEENGWDVGGVVHSHSRALMAFSMNMMDVESDSMPELLTFFHKIPCVPYGRPGTEDILTAAAPFLAEGYQAVILGHHGGLAVGKTVEDAMDVMEAAESVAEQIMMSRYILGSEQPLEQSEIAYFAEVYEANREKRRKEIDK